MTGKEKLIEQIKNDHELFNEVMELVIDNCPEDYGLENINNNECNQYVKNRCIECWKQALERSYD
jgi:hypothetical protein